MTESKAVYAGTFDPVTNGHLDLVNRALKMFDSVIVAVASNPKKKPFFSLRERVNLVKESLADRERVQVDSFNGLLVDYLKKKNARIILRGLRELSDFEKEFQHAVMNRKLFPEADTVFIMTSARFFYVSSSLVKELASLNADISACVPKPVELALRKKVKSQQ